ncbi:MAG: hypothetical protein IE881_06840 [Epsilonproteobacteria bacterium]|nr:hypothetical protein [Campylobacterota bacterium]
MSKIPPKNSQNFTIYKHLLKYGKITTWDAFEIYHILALPARIQDLKNKYGWNIVARNIKSQKNPKVQWKEYTLLVGDSGE